MRDSKLLTIVLSIFIVPKADQEVMAEPRNFLLNRVADEFFAIIDAEYRYLLACFFRTLEATARSPPLR